MKVFIYCLAIAGHWTQWYRWSLTMYATRLICREIFALIINIFMYVPQNHYPVCTF